MQKTMIFITKSVYFDKRVRRRTVEPCKRKISNSPTSSKNKGKKTKLDGMEDRSRSEDPSMYNESTRLKEKFFDVPCEDLAKKLLGKILVRTVEDGTVLKGRIVETECYPGADDRASHSFNGRRTPGNKPMYMKPGTAYVYFTYGMYFCFNISSHGPGAAVLLRAVEPLEGLDRIKYNRQNYRKSKTEVKDIKETQLCNGPSKLCAGFAINKSTNEQDLCTWPDMFVATNEDVDPEMIVVSQRIGIDSVDEPWRSKPLRFYIYKNACVSKFDRAKEQIVKQRLSMA